MSQKILCGSFPRAQVSTHFYFRRERDFSLPLSETFLQVPFGKYMLPIQESSCSGISQFQFSSYLFTLIFCLDDSL